MLHLMLAAAVAFSPARIDSAIASLDGIAAQIQKRTGVPGFAIAVVHDGKIVYAKGFGVRKLGTNLRVDKNTVFELASVSKSLSSTIVAGEVGMGKVKWSEPISKEIPGFTLRDPWVGSHVTIADMFSHRSGLPDHAGETLEDLGFDRAEIIDRLRFWPLSPFRVSFGYTNYGITAGAQAAANAEHLSWDALANAILFQPLGMTSTSYRFVDYESSPDRAWLHLKTAHGWEVGPGDLAVYDVAAPAGGAHSSVMDMAKWMILQLDGGSYQGKQIIAKGPLEETHTPQIVSGPLGADGRVPFNGLGTALSYDKLGHLRISHSGAMEQGAATGYELLPSANLGIVVLTNGFPIGVPESIIQMFYDRVEFGHDQRDWLAFYGQAFKAMAAPLVGKFVGKTPPPNAPAARPNDDYVGTYASDVYGPAIVSAAGKGLNLTIGPKHMVFPLRHWSGDTFVFRPGGGGFRAASELTFTAAGDGHPARLTIEWLNENGLGTFTKQEKRP
jgi:CubicO group peptidase (beta-lactamase class C family)